MENHIVNIEFTSNVSSGTTAATCTTSESKKLVLPKFKPPASVAKKVEPSLDPRQLEKGQSSSTNLIVKGAYSVAREELDDIWGSNDSDEKESDGEDDTYNGIGNRISTVSDKAMFSDHLPLHQHQQSSIPSSSSRIVRTDQVYRIPYIVHTYFFIVLHFFIDKVYHII